MSSDDLFDFSVTEHEPETYKPSVIVKQLHGFYVSGGIVAVVPQQRYSLTPALHSADRFPRLLLHDTALWKLGLRRQGQLVR
jgi:hypothetical protein